MSKKREDLDLLNYKLDSFERRLESLERLILSSQTHKPDQGVTSEVLHLLLDMVRNPLRNNGDSYHQVAQPSQSHHQLQQQVPVPVTTIQNEIVQDATCKDVRGDLSSFHRRRTFI